MDEHHSTPQTGRRQSEVRAALLKLLPDLSNRYGVRSLGLFGSFQRDEHREESDVDILVEFDDRPLTLFQFIALENELSDYLGMKVDLVEMKALKPFIARRMLDAADKAERFLEGVDFASFESNDEKVFAVTRALEIIGEASKHIP